MCILSLQHMQRPRSTSAIYETQNISLKHLKHLKHGVAANHGLPGGELWYPASSGHWEVESNDPAYTQAQAHASTSYHGVFDRLRKMMSGPTATSFGWRQPGWWWRGGWGRGAGRAAARDGAGCTTTALGMAAASGCTARGERPPRWRRRAGASASGAVEAPAVVGCMRQWGTKMSLSFF